MSVRLRGDAGQAGGIEVLPFGLLVFVVGALLVTNVWSVIDAKGAVDSAARAGARAFAEAPDGATGARHATAAVERVLDDSGRGSTQIETGAPLGFARCAPVLVTVTVRVPTLRLPWLGGVGDGFDVTARHGEIVDPHRSGLPGEATC